MGLKFGQPLDQPSRQTLLPVILPTGEVMGYLKIATVTFQGDEVEMMVDGIPTPLKTVTVPYTSSSQERGMTNLYREGGRVQQYVAAYFENSTSIHKPWVAYSSFFPAGAGWNNQYIMPSTGVQVRLDAGFTIGSLLEGMTVNEGSSTTVPTPPDPNPDAIFWEAEVSELSNADECAFIDFDWVELYKVSRAPDNMGTVQPADIEIVNVPPGFQVFKVIPSEVVGASYQYTTLRIVIDDPTLVNDGENKFEFNVREIIGEQLAQTYRNTQVILTVNITKV